MSKELRDADYLEHIQEAIGKIQRYVADKSKADFMADDLGARRIRSRRSGGGWGEHDGHQGFGPAA